MIIIIIVATTLTLYTLKDMIIHKREYVLFTAEATCFLKL